MPICNECKNEVPDDAEFCSKCGAKINAPSMDEPIENTNETSDNNSDGADVPFETKFCYNCGEKVSINAVACPKCGAGLTRNTNVQKQANTKKFCSNCGKEVNVNAVVCTNCGASVYRGNAYGEEKNVAVAALLSIVFPGLGHFYIGLNQKGIMFIIAYIVSAILILLVIGFLLVIAVWIWALIDVVKSTNALNAGEHVEDKLF